MRKEILFLVFLVCLIGFVRCELSDSIINDYVSSINGKVIGEVVVNENGILESGEFNFGSEKANIGEFVIDHEVDSDIIVVSNIKFSKQNSKSILAFDQDEGNVEIYGDKFEGFKSQNEVGHPCYIELDENGNIESLDLTKGDEGGIVVVEGTEIYVPANSRVIYDKDKGIEINIIEGEELKELPKPRLKEGYEVGIQSVRISGKDIKLPEGHVLKEGILRVNDEGNLFVAREEEAIIDTVKFHKVRNDVNIYFDEDFNPEEHQNEDYYFSNGKKKNVKSSSEGEVVVEYLAGDDYFNMYTKDSEGNVIPDGKDYFKISVEKGDSLDVTKNNNNFPLLEHLHADGGEVIFENGRYTCMVEASFSCDKKLYRTPEDFNEIISGQYQSVKFELESDSLAEGYKVRFGCNNQFVF
ncbi:MAG: hypothetical protein OQK82_00735, partial [Candidatus Pacearchaeota archaeon]|nr:hypothetical protein [Candidatus Pacearchaeota archaeon]